MLLKTKEIEIPETEPFKNDKLQREENAKILTAFIRSCDQPSVLCIDAEWGQGKTTFLRMWKQYLKNEGFATLYFSAWENDFSDDALVSLIGEISSSIKELSIHGNISKARKCFKTAKKLSATLLKNAGPLAVKLVTYGAVDANAATEQAIAGFTESIAKEQIEKYEKSKKTLAKFRTALENFANSLYDNRQEKGSDQPEKNPVVFIIDELDRCRPTFAIELLEKVKHFFNVKNFVFVIATDKTQMGHSIKAVYGPNFDVNSYLRRFIDFDYLLPLPEQGRYLESLFQKFGFTEYFQQASLASGRRSNEVIQFLDMLANAFSLTLRDQDHCCSLLSIFIRSTTPARLSLNPQVLGLMIVLKLKKPELYKDIRSGKLVGLQIIKELSSDPKISEFFCTRYGETVEVDVAVFVNHYANISNAVEQLEMHYMKLTQTTNSAEKLVAQRKLEYFKKIKDKGTVIVLEDLFKKLEIASSFVY